MNELIAVQDVLKRFEVDPRFEKSLRNLKIAFCSIVWQLLCMNVVWTGGAPKGKVMAQSALDVTTLWKEMNRYADVVKSVAKRYADKIY